MLGKWSWLQDTNITVTTAAIVGDTVTIPPALTLIANIGCLKLFKKNIQCCVSGDDALYSLLIIVSEYKEFDYDCKLLTAHMVLEQPT